MFTSILQAPLKPVLYKLSFIIIIIIIILIIVIILIIIMGCVILCKILNNTQHGVNTVQLFQCGKSSWDIEHLSPQLTLLIVRWSWCPALRVKVQSPRTWLAITRLSSVPKNRSRYTCSIPVLVSHNGMIAGSLFRVYVKVERLVFTFYSAYKWSKLKKINNSL